MVDLASVSVLWEMHCATYRTAKQKRTEGRRWLWQVSILLDTLLGVLLFFLAKDLDFSAPFWAVVDNLIGELDKLITWLTNNPAGLKLNEPLNIFLARFFHYHIYLWQAFITVSRMVPLGTALLYSLVLGFSVSVALFADFCSLLTLHIFCFEVYANRDASLVPSLPHSLVRVTMLEGETQSLLLTEPSDYGGTCSLNESILESVDPITLSWKNLRVNVIKSNRQLLNNVSGIARPGELMALMGASGAGKTTLLNTLVQRNLNGLSVEGEVLVNGNEMGRRITAVSGYAQQEELFVGTLTVREYLSIQARLRVSGSEERRERRVSIVLRQLGLWKCQHTRIGVMGVKKGISGGEARRLTFACELLSNPPVLFCDEPTTGLDSYMAESVVNVLSRIAHSGRTVLCTIHQPASQLYALFDSVVFLAGGRTAFLGSPQQSIRFFESAGHPCPHDYNPADMIIHTLAVIPNEEVACRERIDAICAHFIAGEAGKVLETELKTIEVSEIPTGREAVPMITQMGALFHRAALDNWRNPSLYKAKLIQKGIMGLFIGLLYLNTPLSSIGITNINGALFYIVAELTYSTLFGIITFLPQDYPLVVREYHDGLYSVFSYYVSKSLSYVPLFTLDGLVMVLICYWMVGFSSSLSQVLAAILICFLIEQSSSAFGVMLSTISPSYAVAVSLGGPLLTLLSLTGGLYANVGALPAYISWIQYLSWFRYGFEALAINQWSAVNGLNSTQWGEEARDEVLSSYSFSASNLWIDQILMFSFILLFYFIGFLGLAFRVKRSR